MTKKGTGYFRPNMNIDEIRHRLASFAHARNWDQFHSPKNLSMALAAEAAELLEIFQWLTDEESKQIVENEKEMAQVRQEIADVMIYLVRLADKLNVDIEKAVVDKIELNEKKYPVELSKDNAVKYNNLLSARNYAQITEKDLNEILDGSIKELADYFIHGRGSKWGALYNISEPICIALCQGAAMHYYDKTNGIKDFDVWFFYPFNKKHLPYRTIWNWDYENPKFGRHPDINGYKGRKVDVIVRCLREYIPADPILTLTNYLHAKSTTSAEELSKKAVVLLRPKEHFSKVIWYKKAITWE